MSDVLVPGGRDVRGTLEDPDPDEKAVEGDPGAIVVACPPHPRQGGSRSDQRLVAVSEALLEAGIACLRFDYGPWDEGYGEREDVRNAIRWASDRYDSVGVFGYSFGATLALVASASVSAEQPVDGVVALAPTARLEDDLDAYDAVRSLEVPISILYGERDSTVDWEPVVKLVAGRGGETVELPADHFFLGSRQRIADESRSFLERVLPVRD